MTDCFHIFSAGIPLKGEAHAPKSMFDDCGKEWFAPQALPEVPKDFKEHPDRDLVRYIVSGFRSESLNLSGELPLPRSSDVSSQDPHVHDS